MDGWSRRPAGVWIEELGRRLAATRLRQNLSQAELARSAGVSLRTLARMEAGEASQLENFLRVLLALGLESGLEELVPEPSPGPIDELEARARATRRRASRSRVRSQRSPRWRWGDDS